MDDIELLSIDDIFTIHQEAIEVFGGSSEYFQDTLPKIKSIIDQ